MKSLTLAISLLFILAIPLEDIMPVPVIGSVARAAGLMASATWLAAVLITNKIRRPHPFHLLLGLYTLLIGIGVFWTIDVGFTTMRLKTYIQILLMTWMIWDIYLTRQHLDLALWAFLGGAYIAALLVLGNYVMGIEIAASDTVERYTAFGFDPNDLGVMLAMAMPMTVRITSEKASFSMPNWLRFFVFLYVPLCTFAILLTASRTASVAMAIGYLFLFISLTQVRLSTRIFSIFFLLAAIYFVPRFVPLAALRRIGELGGSLSSGDLTGRGVVWQQGIEVFVQHPLFGVGSGAFRFAIDYGKAAHNAFIAVLTETGIVGFMLFSAILLLTVIAAFKHSRRDAIFWLTLLMMWAVAAMTLNWEFRKLTWMLFILIITSANALPVTGDVSIRNIWSKSMPHGLGTNGVGPNGLGRGSSVQTRPSGYVTTLRRF